MHLFVEWALGEKNKIANANMVANTNNFSLLNKFFFSDRLPGMVAVFNADLFTKPS